MIDKSHPEWPGIRTWLLEQIEANRTTLESPECRVVQTDVLRGKIAAYREMIATVEPERMPFVPEPARDQKAGY